jgi:hypothetical protein
MARRKTETFEFEGATVEVTELPWDKSEDLLPEVWQLVTVVFETMRGHADALALLEMLKENAEQELAAALPAMLPKLIPMLTEAASAIGVKLGNGRLKALAPQLLSSTKVILTDPETGQKERCELARAEDRAKVFETYRYLYLPVLFLAGKVTYAPFFSGRALPKSLGKAST